MKSTANDKISTLISVTRKKNYIKIKKNKSPNCKKIGLTIGENRESGKIIDGKEIMY